jgi:hypothetical protein
MSKYLFGPKRSFHLLAVGIAVLTVFLASPLTSSVAATFSTATEDMPEASRGSSGSNGMGSGSDGSDGGRGQSGYDAKHASPIDVFLMIGDDNQIRVQGTLGSEKVDAILPISEDIHFDAHGGRGGKGGRGGDGGDGARGSRGSNATRYSSGGNGGPGGDGGDSGQPGAGGNGGNASDVRQNFNERDMDLVMLTSNDVRGGKGGAVGDHGTPGSGGSGGSGGSSYSWTETERRTRTNSEGKSESYTVTVSKSNPGGWDGPSGSSGSRPAIRTSPGQDGKDGTNTYIIHYNDGKTVEYRSKYRVELVDFKFHSQNRDSIFEPGEKVIVENLKIRNTGGMPTPIHQDVRIFIEGNEWVLPDGATLNIGKSLQPGEEFEFPGKLEFNIKDIEVVKKTANGGPFRANTEISPRNRIDRVERVFEHTNPQGFVVQFPIEITTMQGLHTLMPGEGTKLSWTVKNISTKDFGRDSELRRLVESHVGIGEGDLGHESVTFRDASGLEHSLDRKHILKIMKLGPGETVEIDASAFLKPGVKPYHNVNLQTRAKLGTIDAPNTLRDTQIEEHSIRTATEYKHRKGSKYLLVTNNRTTREEIEGWKEFAKLHGREVEIWDLSYHGHLDLSQRFGDSPHILDDFHQGTLILANGIFDPSPGVTAHATDFLTRKDLLLAAGKFGTSIYIPGKTFEEMKELLTPTTSKIDTISYESPKKFMDMLKDLRKEFPEFNISAREAKGSMWSEDRTEFVWEIDVNLRKDVWVKPSDEHLKLVAEKLSARLDRLFPEKSYRLIYNFEPQLIKKFPLLSKTWDYGSIQIRESTGVNLSHAINMPVSDDDIHSKSFILIDQNLFGIYKATRPETKIQYLTELAFSGKELTAEELRRLKIITNALLDDLAEEQRTVRKDKRYFESVIKKRLAILNLLAKMGTERLSSFRSSVPVHSEEGKIIANFIANLEVMLESQVNFFEKLWPGPSDKQTTHASLDLVKKFKHDAFGRTVTDLRNTASNSSRYSVDAKENRKQADQEIKRLKKELKAKNKIMRKSEKRSTSDQGYHEAFKLRHQYNITTDVDLQPSVSERVISGQEYTEIVEAGLDRAGRIDDRVNQNIADRCKFLLGNKGGRISFKRVNDRYYEGVTTRNRSQTSSPIAQRRESSDINDVQRHSDPEANLTDPTFTPRATVAQ